MVMNPILKFFVNGHVWSFLLKYYFLPRLRKFAPKETSIKNILEIGCGAGLGTRVWRSWFPGASITAIDYDEKEISAQGGCASGANTTKIRLKNLKNITVLRADARALPFASSSFDLVIGTNTFHHIKNWQTAISEVARVLAPGGTFLVMDEAKSFIGFPLIRFLDQPESLFTVEEYTNTLQSVNMEVEETRGKGIFYLRAKKSIHE